MNISQQILSDIGVYVKYAKYDTQIKRRETFDEITARNCAMHVKKFPQFKSEIYQAYKLVYERKVLPSMRSMQFAGKPIEINPARIYNCAYLPVDDYRAFGEIMFLLLGGTGVGFSVQKHHVRQLPRINKPKSNRRRRFLIGDNIEGWADAIKALMKSYYKGTSYLDFDFNDIREKGAPLITAGGKAPGPQPLKECLVKIQGILENKQDGERLSPIEVHDIVCHIADAVLAGGIRRAALISLFSATDKEMLAAKFGDWWELNPQRGRANNSAVLVRQKITKQFFSSIWQKIQASNAGEPGIYFTNDKDWGTNPSLRKGTRIWTTEGVFPIEELEDKVFNVRNLDGNISKAKCWLSGKGKRLYKLTLEGGHQYYSTAEHEWPIWDGEKYVKVSTPNIEVGNSMKFQKTDQITTGTLGSYEDGFLSGWQLGDGWTSLKKDGMLVQGLIVSSKDDESGISDKLAQHLRETLGCQANLITRGDNHKELNTTNKEWNAFQERFLYGHKSLGLPKTIWNEASEQFRRGLIDGLFSSDGSVEKSKKRIAFHTSHKALGVDVSDLLGLYGIKHSVRFTENEGKGCYIVDICEGQSIRRFKSLFTLSVRHKQERIEAYTFNQIQPNDQIKVIGIEETDLYEDVWDITVFDHTHAFQLPHVVTGNCCEIALRPFQFCNLVEINGGDVVDQQDLEDRVRSATILATLQATYTSFHYLRPIWQRTTERDALLGLGITGIGSNVVEYLDLQAATQIAIDVNIEWAEMLGINPAQRLTTIKPSGTSSIVLGTSSGVHAWHDWYYIRRMRLGKNESIYQYLVENHPSILEDDYFRPHDTSIVSIPQKAPENAHVRDTESAIQLLERVKFFSENWIKPGHISGNNTHNVSATISIKHDEWDVVGEWMWKNREYYNGLSVLPYDGHTYTQAPFETIDKTTYEQLMQTLHSIDLTKVSEEEDNTNLAGELACAGGACEL